MEKRFAYLLSIILHPLIIPLYGFILLLNAPVYFSLQLILKAKFILLFMTFSATILIPIIFLLFLKRKGVISDFKMFEKDERIYPYLSLSIIYFLLYILFSNTFLHAIYPYYFLSITAVTLSVFFLNLRWKISAHTTAISGLATMFICISYKYQISYPVLTFVIILATGIIGYARLLLETHNPREIYLGYLTGTMISFLMFLLF